MGYIIIFLYVMLIANFISDVTKRKLETTIIAGIYLHIVILYGFGLIFGNLMIGVYICYIVLAVAVVFTVIRLLKERRGYIKNAIEKILSPGVIVFVLFYGYISWINHRRMFNAWDEFSHWGLVVKNMHLFDRFGNYKLAPTIFTGYPPATALWEYFIIRLCGEYKEEFVFVAYGVMIIACIVPIFSIFKKRDVVHATIVAIVMLFIPSIFYSEYLIVLLVDFILGIMPAYLLYFSIWEHRDWYYYTFLFMSASVICLTKASGVFLALVVSISVIICSLRDCNSTKVDKLKSVLVTMGAIVYGKFSWTTYLKISETSEAWNTSKLTIPAIIGLLSGKGEEYQYVTLVNFHNEMWHGSFSQNFTTMHFMSWVLVCILGLIFMCLIDKEKKREDIIYSVTVIIGLVVYTIGMLLLYLFTYSKGKATGLASFTRYMSTYIIFILLFIVFMVIKTLYEKGQGKAALYGEIMLLLMFVFFFRFDSIEALTVKKRERVADIIHAREERAKINNYTYEIDPFKDKVATICQQSDGWDPLVLGYELSPIRAWNKSYWSLGPKYDEFDTASKDITPQEYIDLLIENDTFYVYLYNIDERLSGNYRECFGDEIIKDRMYHLEETKDGFKLMLIQ